MPEIQHIDGNSKSIDNLQTINFGSNNAKFDIQEGKLYLNGDIYTVKYLGPSIEGAAKKEAIFKIVNETLLHLGTALDARTLNKMVIKPDTIKYETLDEKEGKTQENQPKNTNAKIEKLFKELVSKNEENENSEEDSPHLLNSLSSLNLTHIPKERVDLGDKEDVEELPERSPSSDTPNLKKTTSGIHEKANTDKNEISFKKSNLPPDLEDEDSDDVFEEFDFEEQFEIQEMPEETTNPELTKEEIREIREEHKGSQNIDEKEDKPLKESEQKIRDEWQKPSVKKNNSKKTSRWEKTDPKRLFQN